MKTNDDKLKMLITKLAIRNSYWGYLFARIRRKPSLSLPSIMGVIPEKNGTISLMYHPELVENTGEAELTWIIEHEGMHVLNKHISRLVRILSNELDDEIKFKKSKVWNIASDCCVNAQIRNFPRSLIVAGTKWEACFPDLYDLPDKGHTELYYYELLKKQQQCNQGGEGEGKGGDKNIDDHTGWADGVQDVVDQSALSRKIDNYVQGIIKDSIKTFQKRRGELPGHITELIEEALAPPKAPYYQIIRKLVRGSRLSKFRRSPTRINRKRTYVFAIGDKKNIPQISPFPGRQRDFSFNISVLLDTSGSMSKDDILEGLSGCKNIIENDRHCRVTVIENDTKVSKEYEIKKLRDIQFNISGRGGTTLQPGLERCKELNTDITLVFTDAECDNINELPRSTIPKKIIWVVNRNDVSRIDRTGFIVRVD